MNKKNKLAVRIMAWILAGLMVLGAVYFTIAVVVDNIREAQEHTEDDGHDHDHDHDH